MIPLGRGCIALLLLFALIRPTEAEEYVELHRADFRDNLPLILEAVSDLPLTAESRAFIMRWDVFFVAAEYDLVYLLVDHYSACGVEGCDLLTVRKIDDRWTATAQTRVPFHVVGDTAYAWLDGDILTMTRDPHRRTDDEDGGLGFPINQVIFDYYPDALIGERWELSDVFVGYADLNRDGRDEILYYTTDPSGICDPFREDYHWCAGGVLSQVADNYYPKWRLGPDKDWADLGGVRGDFFPCEPANDDCLRLAIIERDGRVDLPYYGLRGPWKDYELKVYRYLPACYPDCP